MGDDDQRRQPLAVPVLMPVDRIVVLSVLLVNAHTWGLNSSYAVFLAHYLRSGTIDGASALGFAFVGGLSISIGSFPLLFSIHMILSFLPGPLSYEGRIAKIFGQPCWCHP